MNLSELITKLETYPSDKRVSNGFAESMSYRGYYEQLAFEPKQDTTIGAMLHEAKAALGRIFQGYKGGDYLMTGYSRVHVCAYGTSNDGDDSMAELFAEIDNELVNALQLQVERLTAERDALMSRLAPYESRTYKVIDESALILEVGKYHKWEDEDGVDWEWFSRDVECDSCIEVALVRADKLAELMAEHAGLKALAFDAAHTMEKARIWGGMDWHYNPLHPIHYTPMLKRLNEALAPSTMPKGYTREQIGLQLDDSREELTAHHVYCRVVAEDV